MSVVLDSTTYDSGIDNGYGGGDAGDGQKFRDKPILLWNSMVSPGGFSASATGAGSPANMWTPDTYTYWKAPDVSATTGVTSSEVIMDCSVSTGINCIAIGKNNLHQAIPGGELILFYWNGGSYTLIEATTVTSTEQSYMFFFDTIVGLPTRFKITFQTQNFVSSIARTGALVTHIKLGIAMILRRRMYVGIEPYPFSKRVKKIVSASENGQFLGEDILRRYSTGSIEQKAIGAAYMRSQILPLKYYLEQDTAQLGPVFAHFGPFGTFFFAWRPYTYPQGLQHCWTSDGIKVKNSLSNGMMDWELDYEAYA